MQATTNDLAPYRRSSVAVAGLRVLLTIRPVLPFAVYRILYNAAFGIYRRIVRYSYRARALVESGPARTRNRLVFEAMPHSLVGWQGLEVTHDAVQGVISEHIAGAIVECGVAQGGSALLMARIAATRVPPREVWLFDSYEGLPEPTAQDYRDGVTGRHVRPLPKGSCLGTIEQVSNLLFTRFGLPRSHVHLVKGWFHDTLPITAREIGAISVLRLDGDWYESTKCCLDHLYDQVAPQGYVILDDYVSCFGCQKATDEFIKSRHIDVSVQVDGRGGAYFRKPAN